MHKIRILALEDDSLQADVLRMVIDELGYELIGIADHSSELFSLLKSTRPDLLLMDIDIGEEINGIYLVKQINEITDIPVIYLTSFKEEQIFKQAKETMPDAYIIKPYDPHHLQSAIELAFSRKQKESSYKHKRKTTHTSSSNVFVKEGDNLIKVCLNSIQLVEAYDKYCFAYTREKKHLFNVQFKSMVENLPPDQFLQVHRSYIINFDAIEKVRLNQNSIEVAGKIIPVSKSYKNTLFSRLKTL